MDQHAHLPPKGTPGGTPSAGPTAGPNADLEDWDEWDDWSDDGQTEHGASPGVGSGAPAREDAGPLFYEPVPDWQPSFWHNPMAGSPPLNVTDRQRRARGDEPRLIQVAYSSSSLIQAASLWLSLTAITRSDATTLAADDPWAGATGNIHADEKGTSARDYLGDDGVALISHYWDLVAPLRASEPSRSLAHCEGCGAWWYVPGGTTKPPKECALTLGCAGRVHKAYKVIPESEQRRLEENKRKKNHQRGRSGSVGPRSS